MGRGRRKPPGGDSLTGHRFSPLGHLSRWIPRNLPPDGGPGLVDHGLPASRGRGSFLRLMARTFTR